MKRVTVIFILTHLTKPKTQQKSPKTMVSPKLTTIIILQASILFISIYESSGASYPSSSHVEITEFDSQKVNLSVYYESLCLPCATFIIKDLGEIFYNDLISIINLQLVPWANSQVNMTSNSIICQNGPDECELNSLEGCALNIWNDVNKNYALIVCFEFLAIEGRQKNWKDCFSQLELPKDPIVKCHNTRNGTELAQKYIDEIALLDTPHTFLPWVVVNNQSIGKEYENFTSYVCKAYRGTSIPEGCKFH